MRRGCRTLQNRLIIPLLGAIFPLLGAGCIVTDGGGRYDRDRHHGDRQGDDRYDGGSHGSLGDLVDLRARHGEREQKDRGYRHRKALEVKDSTLDSWWSSQREKSIVVTTEDGHFSPIVNQPDVVCGERIASRIPEGRFVEPATDGTSSSELAESTRMGPAARDPSNRRTGTSYSGPRARPEGAGPSTARARIPD